MGQWTHAVMLAVAPGKAPELLEEGWSEFLDAYKAGRGPRPDHHYGEDDLELLGFWVAVGGSGKDGCPDLTLGFPLDGFLSVPEYKESYDRAMKAWKRFNTWAAKKGHQFGEPKLWLVQTEVS